MIMAVFAAMIIAVENEDATMPMRPGIVAVLERIAGPIDTRALAVPGGKYAIETGAPNSIDLLRAPDRRCGNILINARLEHDIMLL